MTSPAYLFAAKKSQILAEIASTSPDMSPKGSVDIQILPLINRLNQHDRIFTTSSCSGRISVFFEGVKKSAESLGGKERGSDLSEVDDAAGRAGVGGKGGGGKWLFVSHDPVDLGRKSNREVAEMLFGKEEGETAADIPSGEGRPSEVGLEMGDVVGFDISSVTRFVHLKFEPMILHIQTSDLQTAHAILTAALSAGFRESGIMNPGLRVSSFPMVAIRCNGLAIDSIIGIMDSSSGRIKKLVDDIYLKTLLKVCNLRFKDNQRRIGAFSTRIGEVLFGDGKEKDGTHGDKEARKARRREEGLRKQSGLKVSQGPGEKNRGESVRESVGIASNFV